MPNVLIVGPNGYVGNALTDQLVRSGKHEVFGLVNSESKRRHLTLKEIIPVIGEINNAKGCLEIIDSAEIDIIVDTSSFNNENSKPALLDAVIEAGKKRIETGQKSPIRSQKLGFVTLSGIWTHGSTEDQLGSFEPATLESLTIVPPENLLAAKEQYEQAVMAASNDLDVAVIRPAFIFGMGGASWTAILKPIFDASRINSLGPVEIAVDPEESVFSFTNIFDVATGLELAVDKLQCFNGTSVMPIFDLVADRFPIELLFRADAKIFGYKGEIKLYKPPGIPFLNAIGGAKNASSTRAEEVLGWRPKKREFVRNTHIFANSFLAAMAIAKEK